MIPLDIPECEYSPPDSTEASITPALTRLAAYAAAQGAQNGRTTTLGKLLLEADQLPPDLRRLASRVLQARPCGRGWVLADEERTHTSPPAISLEDRVVALLAEAAPLTEAEILQRLPDAGNVKNVRHALLADSRITMADAKGWTLAEKEPAHELQLFDLPASETAVPRPNRRRRSLKERAEICLLEAGHPMTLQALADRMGGDINVDSLKVQMSADDSFMRSDMSEWALTRWGMRRYTSVKELVAEEVDQAGGSISLVALERNLARDFTIKLTTLRQAASTAPFMTSAGVVRRLNGARDQPEKHLPVAEPHPASETAAQLEPDDASAEEIIDLMGLP